MFGDQQADLREVEDLTTFRADHLGIGEIPSTVPAGAGHMGDHGVGIHHLGQVLSRGTGLLALLALGGPTFGPGRGGRFGEPFGRGRHRRVTRVAAQTLLEVSQSRLQNADHLRLRADQLRLRLDLLALLGELLQLVVHQQLQCGDQFLQLVVRGSVIEGGAFVGRNSPRYACRSRMWWTRLSGT